MSKPVSIVSAYKLVQLAGIKKKQLRTVY